jgi:enolase-phosphatase E1
MDLDRAAEEIVETGVFLNHFGLCPATSGNFSIRLEEQRIAVTASGKHKGELTVDDVLIVDLEGNVQGSTKKPSAETLIHTAIYSLYKDVGAVLHTHSLNGTVLTRLLHPNKTLITEGYEIHKAFPGIKTHESRIEIPIFENTQDISRMAAEISTYLQEHPNTYGLLIRGHGFYTWGRTMKEAKIRVEAFEYLFESELKFHMATQKFAHEDIAKPHLGTDSHSFRQMRMQPVEAILTDIEGTTTSISFVHDVLFPYAKEHVSDYLFTHCTEPAVAHILDEVRLVAEIPNADLSQVTQTLLTWMEQDKKITPLKTLQGMMWKDGYDQGDFQGHVYEDAFQALTRWYEQGLSLYVYSSGSVSAQKLLFSHSPYGDLTPLFSGYFDTQIGGKKESSSYHAIAEQLHLAPGKILFLSDSLEELHAAREAGLQTLLILREATHPSVPNFFHIFNGTLAQ